MGEGWEKDREGNSLDSVVGSLLQGKLGTLFIPAVWVCKLVQVWELVEGDDGFGDSR